MSLLNAAIRLVKYRDNDPSHDYAHVLRVTLLSILIAYSENSKAGTQLDVQVVTLAALFHDLLDAKYLPAGQPIPTPRQFFADFWLENKGRSVGQLRANGTVVAAENDVGGQNNRPDVITEEQERLVERIIDNVSYSKEIKETPSEWTRTCRELHWSVVSSVRVCEAMLTDFLQRQGCGQTRCDWSGRNSTLRSVLWSAQYHSPPFQRINLLAIHLYGQIQIDGGISHP